MTRLDTRSVHAGRDDLTALGVHVPPIDLSTTYPLPGVEAGGASYDELALGNGPDGGSLVYQRLWNPTVARLEEALAELEHCDGAVAFGSGMAALTACLLATVAAGKPHVVAVRPLYGGSDHLLSTGLLGTSVSWATPSGVAAAIRPDTGLVLVETPANPTVELVDIAQVVRQAGPEVPVLVDNTFATPVLQQPVDHGATLVLHSATKYLGGHGDVMGGLVAGTTEWVARLRQVRAVTGGLLHPLAAYELHRGLQTLPVRVRAQQSVASKVAGWLCDHPAVDKVFYPGLPECDPLGLVGRQQAGPGAVLAFTTKEAARVAASLRLITHAVSLGGVDTLIQHPAGLTHRLVAAEARPDQDLLRLSVGLEDAEDLISDLAQALERA
ncbi:cystathionine gamma-synthase/methionine-gamma-lyase [Kribbella voronezhensis]|uniref:homocysteine desulfhydrase n=1 Tax=Kribbella voronezhensis TaxID=2512212 RepID=A0A4R7TD58_9ACTN|nr:PLP-dependent aspartate aminotransferase family protein [Kribbella voronezhensis]TDU90024.1 cystathionine gamma-synthase/methionine-gamma-lyase [Kribbella voronezhensis]